MRLILTLLCLLALPAHAVDRTLSDCTVGATPTALAPLDLDNCTINDGDNIAGILTGLQSTYGNVYLRAPSRTLSVVSDTVAFTADDFYLLEDQSALNKLTVTHAPTNPTGSITLLYSCVPCDTALAYCPLGAAPEAQGAGNWDKPQRKTMMWGFTNYGTVKIGGPSLAVTLVGTHPGLGNAGSRRCGAKPAYATNDMNVGLLDFRITDSSIPPLVDIRANTRNAEVYSVYFIGAQSVNGTTGRTEQVNLAGSHWNTGGLFVNGGVKNIWFDPDRTVISDPYVRGYGWDGAVAGTANGRSVGCFDSTRSANGRGHNSGPFFVDSMTGGVTLEYGYLTFSPNAPIKNVGSAGSPFIVRVKDWGSSGPGTGYTAGVQVKSSSDPIFFKGDPHPAYGNSSPFRFIRFVALPSDYGNGVYGGSLTSCAGGNSSNNNYPDAAGNIVRFEANDNDGINFGWDATFTGNWTSGWVRGQLVWLAYDPWSATDRSYGHTLRAASDMTFSDTITLVDTNKATGPGTFSNINVSSLTSFHDPGYTQAAQANTITATRVSGVVAVGASTGTTTISDVQFTGASRAVITIAAGSTAVVSNLCVPSGSTITGAGTLTYNGSSQSLPYTISPTTGCSIPSDGRPNPPTGGGVN